MKRLLSKILVILMTVSLLLTISGCFFKQKNETADAQSYLDEARRCMEEGDMEAAISTLEVGIRMTDDPILKAYLEGLTTQKEPESTPAETVPATIPETSAAAQTEPEIPVVTLPQQQIPVVTKPTVYENKYSRYAGNWGNGLLKLTITGERMDVFLSTEPNPWGRVATFDETIYESTIQNNRVRFNFTDSWGNYGYCDMTFGNDCIVVTIENTRYESGAMYNFADGTTTYYRYSYESDITQEPEPTETEAPTISYDRYNGSWSKDSCYLRVEKIQEGFYIYLEVGSSFAGEFIVPTSSLNSDCISFYVSDDGYGCSGTLSLQYVDETVVCSVSGLSSGADNGLLDYFEYVQLRP